MKLIYRGGNSVNNKDKNILKEYKKIITNWAKKSRKIAIVTSAKPDNTHIETLQELITENVDIIGRVYSQKINWGNYDLLLILGGDTLTLIDELEKRSFCIDTLKETAIVVGDSAGSYVLSKFYAIRDKTSKLGYSLKKGMYPKSNLITITHANNRNLINKTELLLAKGVAKRIKANLLTVNENESILIENNINKGSFDSTELLNY